MCVPAIFLFLDFINNTNKQKTRTQFLFDGKNVPLIITNRIKFCARFLSCPSRTKPKLCPGIQFSLKWITRIDLKLFSATVPQTRVTNCTRSSFCVYIL